MRRVQGLGLTAAALCVALTACAPAQAASEGRPRRTKTVTPTATVAAAATATPQTDRLAATVARAGDGNAAAADPALAEAAAERVFAVARPQRISRRPAAQRLVIPVLGIDTRAVELGVKQDAEQQLVWETAAYAVGHHQGTANPGDRGNVVMSGHISSRNEGAVFQRLPEIAVGDGIIVSTADRDYLYRVRSTEVLEPTAVHVMDETEGEQLTLITCVPDGVYSHRLIVVATP